MPRKTFTHSRPKVLSLSIAAFVALGAAGCNQDTLTAVSTVINEFEQNVAPSIDVLWVVDNSSSMAEEQEGIGESFNSFINNLIESGVDYHIGVISTDIADGGYLHAGSSGVSVIDRETSNAADVFLENVQVGIDGSRVERAFESTALALGKGIGWRPGDAVNPPNPGFLRDDAALFIIMVSDEDDKSFGSPGYYWRLFDGYKGAGNESLISVSAIVGTGDPSCPQPQPAVGERYQELSAKTANFDEDPVVASICADFSDSLRNLSRSAAGLKSTFVLGTIPNPNAVLRCGGGAFTDNFCVTVNGTAVPQKGPSGQDYWSYNAQNNAIIFGYYAVPPPQAKITVEYQQAVGAL